MAIFDFNDDYIPRFTGHETFHLRYGWLKKAYDAVCDANNGALEIEGSNVFNDKAAISRFGVGKNMVASILHWAKSTGIIAQANPKETKSGFRPTQFGNFIFDPKNGHDIYIESLTSIWLLHWRLATLSNKTTFTFAFSFFNEAQIDRERFLKTLKLLIQSKDWSTVADATLQKDISNLIGTYAIRKIDKRVSVEDVISSPLAELQLLTAQADGSFKFNRSKKPSLSDGVFAYCLMDFWSNYSPNSTTLSFESVCHEPCSPGRAFLLPQQDIMKYVGRLEASTKGAIRWVESSGSRHIARNTVDISPLLDWVSPDYKDLVRKVA